MFSSDFYNHYQEVYPNDLHLKHELWYFLNKFHGINKVLDYIKTLGKKHIHICDIGGGYGYDDLLIKRLAADQGLDIQIDVDVIDPTSDFYNKVHHLKDSDIGKQNKIQYIEDSFVHMDLEEYEGKYDIIICCEVIEHLRTSEQEVFFANFNRILKKWGFIVVSNPNGSSILKGLYGIYTRIKKQNHIFEAEFNYRYSHIGVPTIFQVLGLFQRKWFQVQNIIPTTLLSSTKTSVFNLLTNKLFALFKYLNLFFTTDIVYTAIKTEEINNTKRHNQKKIVLENNAKVNIEY